MGIPSYFSHIIQNHSNILSKYKWILNKDLKFHRLYLDCNSILYDAYKNTDYSENFYNDLIKMTIDNIENYISQIKPSLTFIAFDGVAPLAKMEQQRNRRYKSWFESIVMNKIKNTNASNKDPTCIFTPGTDFMNELSKQINLHFSKNKNVIVSASDIHGEGEHKLFYHLQNTSNLNENVIVYGLDADLLMLSLYNLKYCKNLLVFREAPNFESILKKINENEVIVNDEPWFLDIGKLKNAILQSLDTKDPHRIHDYIFICFLLGNDFLPHHPSINIRTHGIDILLQSYKNCISNKNNYYLINKDKSLSINWSNFTSLTKYMSKNEKEIILQECKARDKWNNKPPMLQPKKTEKEKEILFQNTPMLYRFEESYISPNENGWESRYYNILFNNENIEDICINYLEGLNWVKNYYFEGKYCWRWKYNYSYPPLLKDLYNILEQKSYCTSKDKIITKPVKPNTQLAYVLPPVYLYLLPKKMNNIIQEKYMNYYVNDYCNEIPNLKFNWAYKRYFWECHVKLPNISKSVVNDWEKICT